jgi:DNA modification methylase
MTVSSQTYEIGDCIELLRCVPADSIDTIVTSPPYYFLRDYQVDGQIGLEPTLEEYHDRLLEVTAEIKRVMKPTAVLFWNHGDSYGGSGNTTAKCLTMQNERLIMRMIDEQGFILRNRIIWHKSNGMPSSVRDRFANKYEPVYMLTKSKKYWFDLDAVRVPAKYAEVWSRKGGDAGTPHAQNNPRAHYGRTQKEVKRTENAQKAYKPNGMRDPPGGSKAPNAFHSLGKNPGDVWTINTKPYPESHFATFPTTLIDPMIRAACPAEICPDCGHIRARIVDREFVPQQDVSAEKGVRGANDQKPMDASNQWQGVPRGITSIETTGWTACSCGAGWVTGTVLDPFCGSGTVLEVCRKLNRNAIGFELNPDYETLIRERSMAHTPHIETYFDQEK